ncbi:Sho1p [Malassezia vespertilionis]|uniref:Sho1p n=1 Tax=Malassezia vespertilionis TaxID=2020962 RepID=A0A2N1JFR2_9BASI|nr:Sho1p [Malassezia vespertilionis]
MHPPITSYLVLGFGLLLGFCGWFTAFISQCIAQSDGYLEQGNRAGTHHIWFTIWIELALVIAIIFMMIMGTVGFFKPLLIPFLCIGTVMSVLGADLGIYSDESSVAAFGAGYLLLAFANIIWLLYFAYTESTNGYSMDARNSTSYAAGSGAAAGGAAGVSSGGMRNRFSMGNKGTKFPGFGGFGKSSKNAAMGEPDIHMHENVPTGIVSHHSGVPEANYASQLPESQSYEAGGPGYVSGPSFAPSSSYGAGIGPGAGAGSSAALGAGIGAGTGAAVVPAADGIQPGLSTAPSYLQSYTAADRSDALVGNNTEPTLTQGGAYNAAAGGQPIEGDAVKIVKAEALYTYKASEDDPTEISFTKGDILEIVDSSGKWWQAHRSNGELGIVPSNYLRMV